MAKFKYADVLTTKVIMYIMVAIFVVWVLWNESNHNLCWNENRDTCNSDTYKIDPKEGDTKQDLLQRLWNYTNIDTEKVFWRRSILYAIVVTIAGMLVLEQRLPSLIEFIVGVLFFYILFYFMNSYYTMHFDLRSDNFAKHTINKLRENLGYRESTTSGSFLNM